MPGATITTMHLGCRTMGGTCFAGILPAAVACYRLLLPPHTAILSKLPAVLWSNTDWSAKRGNASRVYRTNVRDANNVRDASVLNVDYCLFNQIWLKYDSRWGRNTSEYGFCFRPYTLWACWLREECENKLPLTRPQTNSKTGRNSMTMPLYLLDASGCQYNALHTVIICMFCFCPSPFRKDRDLHTTYMDIL